MARHACAGKPPEWWWTGDAGNRLALTLCRACPAAARCLTGDPQPHGVIRAATAYSDDATPLPVCGCGYPIDDYAGGTITGCRRCRTPDVPIPDRRKMRQLAVAAMVRSGRRDDEIAAVLRVSPRTVRADRLRSGQRRRAVAA
jgi:hypothetical protein